MTLADRLIDLNRWYEGLPDGRRVFVYPAVLVAAGFVNTRLTGAPIGFVSLAALVALIVVRRSYLSGWLASQAPIGGAVPDTRYRAVGESAMKPEPVRPAVVPVAVERRAVEPAAYVSAPIDAPPAAPVPAQPVSRAVPEEVAPARDVPAPKPIARVEAATATPPSPPARAHDKQAKNGKRSTAPAGRKHEGKSGKRKPADKHP